MLKVNLEDCAYVIRDPQTYLPLACVKYGRHTRWVFNKLSRDRLDVALDHYRALLLPGVGDEVLTIIRALEMRDTHCYVTDLEFRYDTDGNSQLMRYVLCSEHQFDSRVEITLHITPPVMALKPLSPSPVVRY